MSTWGWCVLACLWCGVCGVALKVPLFPKTRAEAHGNQARFSHPSDIIHTKPMPTATLVGRLPLRSPGLEHATPAYTRLAGCCEVVCLRWLDACASTLMGVLPEPRFGVCVARTKVPCPPSLPTHSTQAPLCCILHHHHCVLVSTVGRSRGTGAHYFPQQQRGTKHPRAICQALGREATCLCTNSHRRRPHDTKPSIHTHHIHTTS